MMDFKPDGSLYIQIKERPRDTSWIVAYADMITLLFIFMLVLVTISKVDRAKFEYFKESVLSKKTSLQEVKTALDQRIRELDLGKSMSTKIAADGLRIRVLELMLFKSGEAHLMASSQRPLEAIFQVLNSYDQYEVTVEGHTDPRPIRNEKYSSNWELSSQRATNVIHALEGLGLRRNRMSLQAFADTQPVSLENKQNRRVELRVH